MPLLLALRIQSTLKNLRVCFHIYGCFTLKPNLWLDIGKELKGVPVKLFCASERQKALVAFFEPTGESVATVCPFPVNTEIFLFAEKKRLQTRKKLGLSPNQKLILYSGRISLQKGILRLITEFHNLVTRKKVDAYLAIAGHVDDIGGATSGIWLPKGYFFQKLKKQLDLLPKATLSRILFFRQCWHTRTQKSLRCCRPFH